MLRTLRGARASSSPPSTGVPSVSLPDGRRSGRTQEGAVTHTEPHAAPERADGHLRATVIDRVLRFRPRT